MGRRALMAAMKLVSPGVGAWTPPSACVARSIKTNDVSSLAAARASGVSEGLPPAHVVLHLPVIESRDEPFNEEDVIPRGSVGVCQMVEHSHPRVQFLDRLVGELDHANELGP